MARTYTRANWEVVAAAHKGDHRYALCSVALLPDGSTAATDGKRLLRVSAPQFGAEPFVPNPNAETVLVHPQAAKELRNKTNDRKSVKPEERTLSLDESATAANGWARFVRPDGSGAVHPRVEGHFPPLDSVTPADSLAVATVHVHARLLWEMLRAMEKAIGDVGYGEEPTVTIRINGPGQAIKLTARNKETGQDILGVLMPVTRE